MEEPPAYIEQRRGEPGTEHFWYFCQPTGAYYPTVQGCAEPWIKVAPMAE